MKYLEKTLNYIFIQGKGKHLLMFMLFTIVPSAFLAAAVPAEKVLINIIRPPQFNWWGDLWFSHFNGVVGVINLVVAVLSAIVTTACLCSIIIKHFRVGTFGFPSIITATNDNFFPCLVYCLTNLVLYLVVYTLFSLFEFMWYTYLVKIAYIILSFITGIIFLSLAIYTISSFTLWLPTMAIKGLHGKNAFVTALYQSRSKQKVFLPGHIFVILILVATSTLSFFVAKIWYVAWIIDTIGYTFAYLFSVTYLIIVYFGENYLPREDLARSPYKRRY